MTLVESVDIPLGSSMSPFSLPDSAGTVFNSWDCFGPKGLMVLFTCNHCPYAIAQWPRFLSLAVRAKKIGINTVAINPNIHPDYPQDALEQMRILVKKMEVSFPYLVDGTQQVARQFKAQCTPDPYLFNRDAELAYHGRLDDQWQDETAVTSHDLLDAVEALGSGNNPEPQQHPAMGCSIKWRKDY